jgi:hypothetical protein
MQWRRLAAVGLAAAALGIVWACTLADTVKMKDGRTLTGVADVLGDKVRLTREDGSTVVLNRADVAEITKTKTAQQEYAERAAAIQGEDAAARYALALWCDRQGLQTEAVRECAKALAIDPARADARELMRTLLRAPGEPPVKTEPRVTSTQPWTLRKNLLLEEQPATQDYFRRVVQPVLSETCASAQCHGGPSGGKLRLQRSPISALPGPDVLLPNFDAIYPYIEDFHRPEKCSILRHPLAVKAGGLSTTKCQKVFATLDDARARVLGTLIVRLLLPAGYQAKPD